MSANDKLIKKVIEWVSYAEEDFEIAKLILLESKKPSYRISAFHAQQSAEKFIKSYLVFHKIDFPFTHNIKRLLKLCSGLMEFQNELESAFKLTRYSISARYPGLEKL